MATVLTRKDFVAPVSIRWCPGCGDFAILNTLQNILPTLGIPKENIVIVSGIGCSSRLPYYMDTYGFHTIHGRAPAVATGIKIANPRLSVWVITGDGDGLSIGGNHLIHAIRRNMDLNILLFNNRIYGLTKGQYSPTSARGKITKTSPEGSLDNPVNPCCLALAAEATFVARTIDTQPKHMAEVFTAAARHRGTSFVEIFQNCVTFNNKAWEPISGRDVRDEQLLFLAQGKPLVFGKARNKGIRLNGLAPEIVPLGESATSEKDLLVHDAFQANPAYAYLMSQLSYPDFPSPVGVLRNIERPTYERELRRQVARVAQERGRGDLERALRGHEYWTVERMGREITAAATARPKLGYESRIMDEQIRDLIQIVRDPLTAALRTKLKDIYEKYAHKRAKRVEANEPLSSAIPRFKVFNVSYLMVMDKGKLIGILTERDVVIKLTLHSVDPNTTLAGDLMSPELDLLSENHTVGDAINVLSASGKRYIPLLLESGKYGVVTTKQILWFIHESMVEARQLEKIR